MVMDMDMDGTMQQREAEDNVSANRLGEDCGGYSGDPPRTRSLDCVVGKRVAKLGACGFRKSMEGTRVDAVCGVDVKSILLLSLQLSVSSMHLRKR